MPSRISCCISSVDSPARSCSIFSSERSSSVSRPARSRRSSHITKAASDAQAGEDEERHHGEAERGDLLAADRQSAARLDQAPLAALEDAEHDQPEPECGEQHADDVEPGRVLERGRLHEPVPEQQDRGDDHDLAGEDVAPAELGGDPAADQRPGRDGRPGHPAHDAERERALLSRVGRGDQRDDRGHDQRRADSLDQGPADQEHGEVRAQRGGERAQPVDGQPDRERPVAPDDVTELRSREHQRGHHERVGGDRQLNARDRRVQVRDDLRDRHVHDAAVEHHHELGRREDAIGRPSPERVESPWDVGGDRTSALWAAAPGDGCVIGRSGRRRSWAGAAGRRDRSGGGEPAARVLVGEREAGAHEGWRSASRPRDSP